MLLDANLFYQEKQNKLKDAFLLKGFSCVTALKLKLKKCTSSVMLKKSLCVIIFESYVCNRKRVKIVAYVYVN